MSSAGSTWSLPLAYFRCPRPPLTPISAVLVYVCWQLVFNLFEEGVPFDVCGVPFTGFPVNHGLCTCTAYRVGAPVGSGLPGTVLVYMSDVKAMCVWQCAAVCCVDQ
jgi:hypothetical protein